jgi:PAS domain-containing protein
MKTGDETILLPTPAWRDPRTHLLDDIWLLTIAAILLAIMIPWVFSSFGIELARASWGLLALGAVHMAFAAASAPGKPRTAGRVRLLAGLHALGVIFIGFIWLNAGGLQNAMFLAVFALPVIGSVFISRWQPYLISLLAIVVVSVVALVQAPELRWYAAGLRGIGQSVSAVFGNDATGAVVAFPGFYAPSSYFLVVLQVFAVLVIACAVAAEHLGAVFERMYASLMTARADAQRGQELWTSLIEQLPVPALLADADTSQVICASAQLAPGFCELDADVVGNDLFKVIRFSYPEVVQELIGGFGGTAPLTMIRVGEQIRITDVRVQHVSQRGRRFALLVITDTTEEFIRRAALEAADHAALIVDEQGRILGFNHQATALFPDAQAGSDADALFTRAGLGGDWMQPQLTGKRRTMLEIGPRLFQVTISPVVLPGEEERIHVIAFLPVGRAGARDNNGGTRATFIGAMTGRP